MHEKCGYKMEGVLRNSVFKNGKFQNQIIMSILREEFDIIAKEKNLIYEG
jgi:RimJ/RimL family protein N-acetyltransferase